MKSRRIFQESIIKTEKIKSSKIPLSKKEEIFEIKHYKNRSQRISYQTPKVVKFTKRDADKIIKIQRWWKNILLKINSKIKTQKIYLKRNQDTSEEKYSFSSSSQDKKRNKNDSNNNNIKNIQYSINSVSSFNTNINTYSNNTHKTQNLKKNHQSKSYSNINSNTYNTKNSNIKNNYIQTITRKTEMQTNPQYPGSLSSSPSDKSRYFIETKKIEIFRKPKSSSDNKSKNSVTPFSEISKSEVKNMMRNIWNEESFCSTVESLSCISEGNKSNNMSQNNTIILEEYEEEINKLKTLLLEKDHELNNLVTNLKLKQGNILDNKTWNEIIIPSPINEIHIESIKRNSKTDSNNAGNESVSDSEGVLEIQEMNALSIISKKRMYNNICQHLQSISILSRKYSELNEEYIIERLKDKEDLIIQKIEEINVTSIIPRPKDLNQIQELDGLQILSIKHGLKKKKYIKQNLDKIFIKSLRPKKQNIIQELDGLEIIKGDKQINNLPQCVDELLIPREYDMLLVKPMWNKLKVQGTGLNILALEKDRALENQEIDEFIIPNLEKPKLLIQSQEKLSLLKSKFLQKIKVLIPLPENNISQIERFEIKGNNINQIIQEPSVVLNIEQNQNLEIPKSYETAETLVIEKQKDWNEIIRPIKTTKVVIKSNYFKMQQYPIKTIKKEEIETIERIYHNKNWNEEIKPIKPTKLRIKGIKNINTWENLIIEEKNNIYIPNINIPKIKEELIIESFSFNLDESGKKFRQKLFIENSGFNLINMNIKKKRILLPYKCEQINLGNIIKKEKKKVGLKLIKENYLFIRGKEKIILKKNWNEFNKMIHNNNINLIFLKKNKNPILIKQKSNSINLIGKEIPQPQIITVQKNWNNLLRGQKSGKFSLLSKANLSKKNKLLVANGDKFFIQKEIEDDIIYNDDYNTRKEKQNQKTAEKEKSNNEIRTEIIKEKEIIPRYQREIRAQIAKVKELSESDSSSLSEIDVLEGIRNKKNINKELPNISNGYKTQIINSEVIYTAKNGLGFNTIPEEEQSLKIIENKIIKNDSLKQVGVKKQIIINNTKSKKSNSQNNENMNGQSIINNPEIKHDINMSPKFQSSENKINLDEINKQTKKGQIIFNPKIKTSKVHYSTNSFNIPHSGNVIINSRRECDKKFKTGESITERNVKEKEGEKIKMKRSKIKNVELMRDLDSQNSF